MTKHQTQEYYTNPFLHDYNNNHHNDMKFLSEQIQKIFKQIYPDVSMKTLTKAEKLDFIKGFLLYYKIEDFTKDEIAKCLLYTLEVDFSKKDYEVMLCKKL